jgi:hypothetical protein
VKLSETRRTTLFLSARAIDANLGTPFQNEMSLSSADVKHELNVLMEVEKELSQRVKDYAAKLHLLLKDLE